ncbi:MAG TPA: hypothetical protein VN420_00790 [Candidatus Fimivivens sp.]|nr:hypothetical protein [Candidatus Fimivivens sp.]
MKLSLKHEPFRIADILPLLSRYTKWFFMFLFFAAFGAGMCDWYMNVYRGDWTDEQKRQYVESAFRETVLREDAYRSAVAFVSRRAESNETSVSTKNNFFRPIPGSIKTGQ